MGLLAILVIISLLGVATMARLRDGTWPHRSLRYLTTMGEEWLVLCYVAWGIRRQGGSLRDVIGGQWLRMRDFARDLLLAATSWILAIACMGVLLRALRLNHGVNIARYLAPQNRLEMFLWLLTSLSAGFCEEIVFRGYLQRQLIAWSGKPAIGILLSALAFGGMHAYQGPRGPIVLSVFGILFGLLARWRRSLRPGMMAHAWHDELFGLVFRTHVR
jgi:membrane protease YdiL (CAAX protease family)